RGGQRGRRGRPDRPPVDWRRCFPRVPRRTRAARGRGPALLSTRPAPAMFHLDKTRFGAGTALHADVANLAGDYSYLTTGYYASLDAELAGLKVLPTTADALDAYVVPIAMENAHLAGLAVPAHEIVT